MSARGVALILVLGLLLAVSAVLGVVMTAARQTALSSEYDRLGLLADDLLRASEPLVRDWLERESQRAVVPIDSPEPRVPIFTQRWTTGSESCSLTLTAWDQLGMVPQSLSPSHALARSLPSKHRSFLGNSDFDLTSLSRAASPVYPDCESHGLRPGARIATHSPKQLNQRTASDTPVVNINTAPESLLRASLVLAQRAEFDSIAEHRRAGTISPAPQARGREGAFVALAGSSPLWAIRVDARVGPIVRSWWTVYGSTGGEWEILSRHEIAE